MTDEEYQTWYLAEAERNGCTKNEHGDSHCWHWLYGPPRLDGPVWWAIARCCWCGTEHRFTYEDVIYGRVPVTPSLGAVHGTWPTDGPLPTQDF